MKLYIHENKHWPSFTWAADIILPVLSNVRHKQGRIQSLVNVLGFELKNETVLKTLTLDVIKSAEIEGELLDTHQVRSSIARKLGLDIAGLVPSDRNVDGIVEVMLDATQNYQSRLTDERLFAWHAALFPTGRSGLQKITVGRWRKNDAGPMQVVSGALGKEKVHFQAPEADRLGKEMQTFLKWFNKKNNMDDLLKSAMAHLWFVTIHPFDDGNGRIARAIADMQLVRADQDVSRFYSVSAQIRTQRKHYYDILERTQKGNLDITEWLIWFLKCVDNALNATDTVIQSVVLKARFWEKHFNTSINERQHIMINKLFDGFSGNLNSSKWAKICKCSSDTALRDINDLLKKEILKKNTSGGRSTSYLLK